MIIEVEGSSDVYSVDTEKVTCTCPNFRYRCSHYTPDRDERLCKHLVQVYQEHPELKPISLLTAEDAMNSDGKDPDGKKRFPRVVFDSYVSEIKSILSQFNNIITRFEFCGSYRRLSSRVSDLDVLIEVKPDMTWDPVLDYLENVMHYQLISEIGRGSKKAAYMIDGFIHVDFRCIDSINWPFALLHFTGSKVNNIEMRRVANSMGLKLNEYGLFDCEDNRINGLDTEESIYRYLGIPFKHPWER